MKRINDVSLGAVYIHTQGVLTSKKIKENKIRKDSKSLVLIYDTG